MIEFEKPRMCDLCRLGKLIDSVNDVSNDFSEAYYKCPFFEHPVWGERALCTTANWIDYFSNQENEEVKTYWAEKEAFKQTVRYSEENEEKKRKDKINKIKRRKNGCS